MLHQRWFIAVLPLCIPADAGLWPHFLSSMLARGQFWFILLEVIRLELNSALLPKTKHALCFGKGSLKTISLAA